MEPIISTVSWLLTKAADAAANTIFTKATQAALNKVGVFDAICEKCSTVQPAIPIPENRPFTLECPKCGNVERILVESVDKLMIRSIRQANIVIGSADVLVNQANFLQQPNSQLPLLPDSEKQPQKETQASLLPAEEFQSSYGIIERKVVERAIQEAIDDVQQFARTYDLPRHAIKDFAVSEIRVLAGQTGTRDVVCPEIWIVPDSRKSIAGINAVIQKKIEESLKEIGLSLGRIVTRIFDEKLPKQ